MSCLNHACSEKLAVSASTVPVSTVSVSTARRTGGPVPAGHRPSRATKPSFSRRFAGAVLLFALGAVAAGTVGCSRDPGPNDFDTRMTIDILEGATALGVNGFSPNPAVCTRGTLVLWTNRDTVNHRIVSTGGFFDSGIIEPGQSYQRIFRELGNFRYHDEVPNSSIQGVLNVIE